VDTAYRWMSWFKTSRITSVLETARISSARGAVTHGRRRDSIRSFSNTGLSGGAKLAVVNIGGQRRTSPQRVERPDGVSRDRRWPMDVGQ
jgi:hypothetical protein